MRLRGKNHRTIEYKDKALFDFAHSYLMDTFPNPNRQGCPSESALQSLAVSPMQSDPLVTEHLASCSPCFRRYTQLLAALQSEKKAESKFHWGSGFGWMRAHQVLAGTVILCLLFIVAGISILLRRSRLPSAPLEETHRTPASAQPGNSELPYAPFSADLSELSRARGSEPPETGPVRFAVPGSRLDLTVTLPLASREGRYQLSLTSGDRIVWRTSGEAHLKNGKTLIRVKADFTKVPVGDYNLEVQSSSGLRLIQPVSIQAPVSSGDEQRP